MRKTSVPALLLMVPFFAAAHLGAQDRALLVSGVFADSSIVGPAVRFSTGDSKGSEWLLTLMGSSFDAQYVTASLPSPRVDRFCRCGAVQCASQQSYLCPGRACARTGI